MGCHSSKPSAQGGAAGSDAGPHPDQPVKITGLRKKGQTACTDYKWSKMRHSPLRDDDSDEKKNWRESFDKEVAVSSSSSSASFAFTTASSTTAFVPPSPFSQPSSRPSSSLSTVKRSIPNNSYLKQSPLDPPTATASTGGHRGLFRGRHLMKAPTTGEDLAMRERSVSPGTIVPRPAPLTPRPTPTTLHAPTLGGGGAGSNRAIPTQVRMGTTRTTSAPIFSSPFPATPLDFYCTLHTPIPTSQTTTGVSERKTSHSYFNLPPPPVPSAARTPATSRRPSFLRRPSGRRKRGQHARSASQVRREEEMERESEEYVYTGPKLRGKRRRGMTGGRGQEKRDRDSGDWRERRTATGKEDGSGDGDEW